MKVSVIRTHRIEGTQPLAPLLDRYVVPREETIVAVTSKIVSVCEGRLVPRSEISKVDLVRREADAWVEGWVENVVLTIKNNWLIPSAGIDESNTGGKNYILYPSNVDETVRSIWDHLRKRHRIERLGVLIVDSRTTPLRRGVTGMGLSWCGFQPLHSCIGKPDLYGHPMRMTEINLVDGLAAAAVLAMGESNEQTPFAIIEEAPKVAFVPRYPTPSERQHFSISPEEDLYGPLLKVFKKTCPTEE